MHVSVLKALCYFTILYFNSINKSNNHVRSPGRFLGHQELVYIATVTSLPVYCSRSSAGSLHG